MDIEKIEIVIANNGFIIKYALPITIGPTAKATVINATGRIICCTVDDLLNEVKNLLTQ